MEKLIHYVPGELHPDLFGGETPIMIPIDGADLVKVYHYTGYFVTTSEHEVSVLACSEEEAAEKASRHFEDQADFTYFDGRFDDMELSGEEEFDPYSTPENRKLVSDMLINNERSAIILD